MQAWTGEHRGEWEIQFLETDWENITFLELSRHALHLVLSLALQLLSLFPSVRGTGSSGRSTHQSAFWLDGGAVLAIHLVVQSAGIAQVVARTIPSPKRSGGGSTVDTLAAL